MKINALRERLSPIANLGYITRKVEVMVGDTPICFTLRTLTAQEQFDVSQRVRDRMRENQESGTDKTVMVLIYHRDLAEISLSRSIIEINGETIPDMIDTDEVIDTKEGKVSVKIPRHEAIHSMMDSWDTDVLAALMGHFTEILGEAEDQIGKAIKVPDRNLDAEIRVAEIRLQLLKERKEQAELSLVAKAESLGQSIRESAPKTIEDQDTTPVS